MERIERPSRRDIVGLAGLTVMFGIMSVAAFLSWPNRGDPPGADRHHDGSTPETVVRIGFGVVCGVFCLAGLVAAVFGILTRRHLRNVPSGFPE